MSQDKKISLHYEKESHKFAEIEIILREDERFSSEYGQHYDVLIEIDGSLQKVDVLSRDPRNVTHQVHSRLRYDNKPHVRFRAQKSGLFYEDTRVEALGDIIQAVLAPRSKSTVHLPGRPKGWWGCDLCEAKSDSAD